MNKVTEPSPTVHESMSEAAYRFLKDRVMDGVPMPGAPIDEKEIADILGTSRTPVREAVQRLAAEGFLVVLPRRGTHVVALSPQDIDAYYELLTALEVHAVVLLARRRPPPKELAPLKKAVADMQAALKRSDRSGWMNADERFHRGLLALCGNERIAEAGFAYRDRVQRAHAVALRLRGADSPARSAGAHAALLALIAAGKVGAARDAHLAQRERAGRELAEMIARAGLRAL